MTTAFPLGHEPLGLELGAERLEAEGQSTHKGSMRIGFIRFFGTMVKASSGHSKKRHLDAHLHLVS